MIQVRKSFTKKELTDSGLALLLLTLLSSVWIINSLVVKLAIAEVLVLLIAPVLIYPFAFLWLNLSELLGKVISKVILSLIFIVFVCPVGLVRKAMSKDSLSLKQFRKDTRSVFKDRENENKIDFTTSY